jgi:hypothetical protein
MAFVEGTTRDALGGIVIQSRMRMFPARLDFEKQFFPGVEVGLAGWERAHSQGKITGVESPEGIRYAPSEVNQGFQRLGIERFIRELFQEKAGDVDVWLTTVTYTHRGTLRLKEIQYRVDVVANNVSKTLFEASIEVEDARTNPRVTTDAKERTPRAEWLPFIKNAEGKRIEALMKLAELHQRVKNLADLYKGEHTMQLDLIKHSVAGYLTNKLFNSTPPTLEIWGKAIERLAAAKSALLQRDVKKATKEIFLARAQYLFALKKYAIWKNGIEGAGTNMQIAIGAVAAIIILTAIGAYVVAAPATAGGAEAGIIATEQAAVRARIATQQLEATLNAIEAISAADEAAALAEYEAAMETFASGL